MNSRSKESLSCDIAGYLSRREMYAEKIEPACKARKHDRLWSIILAGGNGDRISLVYRPQN
jgi:hypothetical protein